MTDSFFSNRILDRAQGWQHWHFGGHQDTSTDYLSSYLTGDFTTAVTGASWETRFHFHYAGEDKIIDRITMHLPQKILSDIELSILDLACEYFTRRPWKELCAISLRELQQFLQDGHGVPAAPVTFQWNFLESWLKNWPKAKFQESWPYLELGRKVNGVLTEAGLQNAKCVHLQKIGQAPHIFCQLGEASISTDQHKWVQQKLAVHFGEVLPTLHFLPL
jgi:hypothetical protein